MKTKDIQVGQEYAVRRGRTGACFRARVEESAKVVPPRDGLRRWHVLLPGETLYSVGAAEVWFRCSEPARVPGEAAGRLGSLGQPDERGRRWLPPRAFVSTWEEYAVGAAREQEVAEAKRTRESAEQEAWRPLVAALKAFGLGVPGWDLPRGDRLEVVLTRAQATRIVASLGGERAGLRAQGRRGERGGR